MDAISLYTLSGYSLTDISNSLSLSKSKVYRILKANGIVTNKTSADYISKLQDYKIDDLFFENIDTSEKAYVLGFMYADGNLHKKYYHIKLKLQATDKSMLEKINSIMQSNKPLYHHKSKNIKHQDQYSIVISNKKMYQDIMKHGLYPNKTYDLKFTRSFNSSLLSHFIRGYFDGDGWITSYGSNNPSIKKNVLEAGFTGTHGMCEFVKQVLCENNINSSLKIDKRTDNRIISLRIRGAKNISKFKKFVYKDSTLHLERKEEKFNHVNIK